MIYDVLIIGSGIIGSSIAHRLSHLKAKVVVVDKEDDVCEGTSKANSAILHSGFDAKSGSLKAKFNILGNQIFQKLAKDLEIDYKRNGALVVCTDVSQKPLLEELLNRGKQNGVKGLDIIDRDELRDIEPNISDNAVGALYSSSSSIVCPFEFNIALAENAVDNGVEFAFENEVVQIEKAKELFIVRTSADREFISKVVVNCAGVYSDKIHNMVCSDKIQIMPRRGEYLVLDKVTDFVKHTIFPLPSLLGKGILITPTVHGNILLGPTAEDIVDKEDVKTTKEAQDKIIKGTSLLMKNIPFEKVINSFAGLRSHELGGDFIIGENKNVSNFIDCAGIESPGLTAAPAIGWFIKEIIRKKLNLEEKAFYTNKRKGILRINGMKKHEYKKLVEKDSDYAKIICKCNNVSLGEIKDSIKRSLGAVTLDGIKRRTYALMGRCQGSICMAGIAQILADEKKIDISSITKKSGLSLQCDDDLIK